MQHLDFSKAAIHQTVQTAYDIAVFTAEAIAAARRQRHCTNPQATRSGPFAFPWAIDGARALNNWWPKRQQ
jgi:hypothetical protein